MALFFEIVVLPSLIEGASVLLNYASDVIPQIDFGNYTSVAIIVSSIVINACRKLLKGQTQ